MENVEFPISWTNTNKDSNSVPAPDAPWTDMGQTKEEWEHSTTKKSPVTTDDLEFENQNFQPPIYITLARLYDLLAVIALKVDPESAEGVISAHEAGRLVGESPYLVFDENDILPQE